MPLRNEVQLITYADRLAGDLPGLVRLLRSDDLAGAFGGVHVLPFFTPYDGADAGFDPIDHTTVDPRLGSWDDIRELARTHDVVVDLIVNHVAAGSAAFRDVVERGEASGHYPMFLTLSSVFPDGATEDDLTRIYRPRLGVPFRPIRLGGRLRYVWTTFTPEQIDIDVRSAPGKAYLASILDAVAAADVRLGRLDAVGYAVKTPGTTSFRFERTASSEAMLRALVTTVSPGVSPSARATSVEVVPPVSPTVEPSSTHAAAAAAIRRFSSWWRATL